MANSDKNILITPNVSAATGTYPSIKFNGANNTPINLNVLDDGTTSFTATSGQLFSISDVMTGSIFSVNDISGVPSMEVLDTGLVKINQYSGSTVFGGSTAIQSGTVNSKVSVYTALANTPGIIIKGVSSQSSDLQIWQNSSGTLLSSIKADGGFYMPNSGTANTKFQIGSFLLNGYGANYTMETVTIGSYIDTDRFASGGLTIINRGGASNIPLGIKAAASQTADLTQWRNSAGTIMSGFNSGGALYLATTASFANTVLSMSTGTTTNIGIAVRAVASQTANLQEWQNSSGTQLVSISASGNLRVAGDNISAYRFQGVSDGNYTMNFPGSGNIQLFSATDSIGGGSKVLGISNATTVPSSNPTGGGILYVESGALKYRGSSGIGVQLEAYAATDKPLIIKGAASQSADLQQWQNSNGTVLSRIAANGVMKANVGLLVENSTLANYTALQVNSNITNGNGIIVVGASGQTADLQQWNNSTGTVLSNVDANGHIVLNPNQTATTFPLRIWTQGSATTPYGLAVTRSGQSLQYIHIHEADGSKHVIETAAISAKAFYIRNNQAESLIFATNGSDRVNINSSGNVLISGFGSSTPGLTVKGAVSQTSSLQQWQNSAGTSVAYIDAGGGLTASYLSINGYVSGTRASIIPNNSSEVGLIVKGVASQANDLQQWQDSTGLTRSRIDQYGGLVTSIYLSTTPDWNGGTPLYVSGLSGQTGDLTQWKDSSGNVLTKVNASGVITAPAINVVGQSVSSNRSEEHTSELQSH